jgi:hypothetical protein
MPSLRPVYFFVLKVAIVYGLFLIPWPGAITAYRAAFCFGGNIFFRTLGGTGRVYLSPIEQTITSDKDVSARLENIETRATGIMEINSRLMGYLPTGFTIALIAAAPVPRKRRAFALLWGTALISVFVGVLLGLRLVNVFSNSDAMAVYAFGSFWKGMVVVLLKVLALSPVTAYIAPVVIWALVCFRREDLVRIVSQVRGPGAPTAPQAARS